MASNWSQSTLLRRMEEEFAALYGHALVDTGTGEPTEDAETITVGDFVRLISRQIVVEVMTGRKVDLSKNIKPAKPKVTKKDAESPTLDDLQGDG